MCRHFTTKPLAFLTLLAVYTLSIPGFAFAVPPANSDSKSENSDNSCATCTLSKNSKQDFADKLATLGRQSQNKSLLPVRKSVFTGVPIEYVSTATGELAFAVEDISFAGATPLFFQRVYSSNNNEDIGLGKGWNFAFNDKIELNFNEATLTNSAGEKYEYIGEGFRFAKDSRTQNFVLKNDQPALVQSFQQTGENLIKEKNPLAEKTYEKFGGTFYLTKIEFTNNQQQILLERFKDGRLAKVSSKIGEIKLNWSNGQNPRLLSLTDNTGRTVKFTQNAGQLEKVKTVLGGNWNFKYEKGKLAEAVDPMNRTMLKAVYDASGRVIRSGDAVRQNTFKYEDDGHPTAHRTVITDSLNYAVIVEHNENGSVKRTFDDNGYFADFKYDELNRLTSVVDENGQVVSYDYDSKGRLTHQYNRNMGEESFQYDDKGNVSSRKDDAKQVKILYDKNNQQSERNVTQGELSIDIKLNKNGNPTEKKISDGRLISLEYDDKGREIAAEDSGIGRYETFYNATGERAVQKLPSGSIYYYNYNADNQITGKSDSTGSSIQAEYDQSGAMSKIGNKDFWVKNTRDSVGRIIKVESSAGQSRHFRYDIRGALIEYINAKNEKFGLFYNEQGKLQTVTSPKGVIFRQRETQKMNPVAFVKSNYTTESLLTKQIGGITPCEIFANDNFGMNGQPLTMVNGIAIDLSANQAVCDPYASSGDEGGFGGFWMAFGGNEKNPCQKAKDKCSDDSWNCYADCIDKSSTGAIAGAAVGAAVGAVVGGIGAAPGALVGAGAGAGVTWRLCSTACDLKYVVCLNAANRDVCN